MTGIATQPALSAGLRLGALRAWPARRWLLAGLAAPAGAVVLGVPTGVIPTPLYTRMTPVRWWNYPVLAISAALLGLTAATYLRSLVHEGEHSGTVATGGRLLAAVAVRHRLPGLQQARGPRHRGQRRAALVRAGPANPRRRLAGLARRRAVDPPADRGRLPNPCRNSAIGAKLGAERSLGRLRTPRYVERPLI